MSTENVEDIKKHIRVYMIVFVALAALTLVTVGVSYLDLPTSGAIALALLVASVKGFLVAGYFMHLLSEKKVIFWILIICVVFFIHLLLLPVLTSPM